MLIDEGANIKAVGKDGRTPLHDAAQAGSDRIICLLNLENDTCGPSAIAATLKLWENAASGFHYRTIDALMNEIFMADSHITFDSIVWEWELPAIVEFSNRTRGIDREAQWSDAKEHVVLMSNDSSTDYIEGPAKRIQAMTCAEYLTGRWKNEWSGFVLGLLGLLYVADLNPAHLGVSFNFRAQNLPL